MRKLMPAYSRALEWVLVHPRAVAIGAVLTFGLAALAYVGIGKTFMPTMDEGAVLVQTEKLPSINLAHSIDADLRLQQALLAEIPEVRHAIARVGSDELGFDPMGLNQTDMFLVLAPGTSGRLRTRPRCWTACVRCWIGSPAPRMPSRSRSKCACRRC